MAHLVATSLARRDDVAVDFAAHRRHAAPGVLDQELDRLLARPLHRVYAGVHHQAAGAELLPLQIADLAERIVGVQAEFVHQLLGIQRPAFDEGIETHQRRNRRQLVMVLGQVGQLPGVARQALVRGQRGQFVLRPQRGRFQVDVVDGRALAVQRGRVHIAQRCAILDVGRHALDDQWRFHLQVRDLRHQLAHGSHALVAEGDQLGAALVVVGVETRRILGQRLHAFAHRALRQALRLENGVDARLQHLVLLQADGVDFGSRVGGGGAEAQRPVVIGRAVRQAVHAGNVGGLGGGLGVGLDLALQRRIYLGLDQFGDARVPVAGDTQLGGALGQRGDQLLLVGGGGAVLLQLRHGLGCDEVGWHDALGGLLGDTLVFLIQHTGQRGHPFQIGLGIGRVGDLVLAVEEFGNAEDGAVLLRDRERRSATAKASRGAAE